MAKTYRVLAMRGGNIFGHAMAEWITTSKAEALKYAKIYLEVKEVGEVIILKT
jgi:hypothetical protein